MNFIQPEHRLPLQLGLSLYETPIEELAGFQLIYKSYRIGIWKRGQLVVIGCKGTTVTHKKDVVDDLKLATSNDRCSLSLVHEVEQVLHMVQESKIIFVGHSLGGAAAMCLATKVPNSIAIVYNAAAPPTNPVLSGPGPQRAIHYHVMGDIISSHMSPNAATIVRVHIPGPMWNSTFPHATERLNAPQWQYVSVDQEQESWNRNGATIMKIFGIWNYLAAKQFVCSHPIPGSTKTCSWSQRLLPF